MSKERVKRYEVTVTKTTSEDSYHFDDLQMAYDFFIEKSSLPAEVALHDLDLGHTISHNRMDQ